MDESLKETILLTLIKMTPLSIVAAKSVIEEVERVEEETHLIDAIEDMRESWREDFPNSEPNVIYMSPENSETIKLHPQFVAHQQKAHKVKPKTPNFYQKTNYTKKKKRLRRTHWPHKATKTEKLVFHENTHFVAK